MKVLAITARSQLLIEKQLKLAHVEFCATAVNQLPLPELMCLNLSDTFTLHCCLEWKCA